MKKSLAIILAGLACIILITAGCTSSSGTSPAITPVATPVAPLPSVPQETKATPVAAAAPAAATVSSWSGTWNSTYSSITYGQVREILTLTQSGSSVTGTYNNGNGTIKAAVLGGGLAGSWSDSDSNGTYSGLFEFEQSADEKSFSGRWVSLSEGPEAIKNTTQFWNGVKA